MPLKRELTDFQRIVGSLTEFEMQVRESAFLVVDMHYFQTHRDYGFGKRARGLGLSNVADHYLWSPRRPGGAPLAAGGGLPAMPLLPGRAAAKVSPAAAFRLRFSGWPGRVCVCSRRVRGSPAFRDECHGRSPGRTALQRSPWQWWISTRIVWRRSRSWAPIWRSIPRNRIQSR